MNNDTIDDTHQFDFFEPSPIIGHNQLSALILSLISY